MPDRTDPLLASPDTPPPASRRRRVVAGFLGVTFLAVGLLWLILLVAVIREILLSRQRATKEEQRTIWSVRSVAFSPDGNHIVSGSIAFRWFEVNWGRV